MLRLPPIDLVRPQGLREALVLLDATPAPRILGGGTDLLVALKQGLGSTVGAATPLLSLRHLPLAGIRQDGDAWTLGAGTTLWELGRWRPSGALAALSDAARQVAAPPIQSRGTLGGNLCLDNRCFFYNQSRFWRSSRPACYKAGGAVCHVAPGGDRCHACHQADLPPVLLALGAEVQVQSNAGSRTAPVASLYSGDGRSPLTLAARDLITAVTIPRPAARSGAAWEKIRMRKGLDFALASAAAFVECGEDGTCRRARIVLGSVGTSPIPVPEAEEALCGRRPDEKTFEDVAAAARRAARPMKNTDLTPAYRRRVAGVAAKRAAERAWRAAAAPL